MMDPAAIEGLQDAVAGIYSDAEVQLVARIAAAVAKGLDAPQWATAQLASINGLAREARGFLLALDPVIAAQVEAAIAEAAGMGAVAADADIAEYGQIAGSAPATPVAAPAVNTAAVAALAEETIAAVTDTHAGILRSAVDGYREVVAEVVGRTVTGAATRREVTQHALNKFAARGLTGFRDKAGRNWQIDTYAEMAVRTATLRAFKQGHTDRLVQRGYDLVVISSHSAPAPQCQPFEGKLVSLSGETPNGPVTRASARTGAAVKETVAASMREAEAAGLHHPNCKHKHTLWVPGASRPPVVNSDPQAYKDEQKLRRLERGVRKALREEAAATSADLDPVARKLAGAKVRARRAAIRDHVAATGVKRRPHRERLRIGDAGDAGTPVKLTRLDPPPPPAPVAPPAGRFDHLTTEDEIELATVEAIDAGDFDALDLLEAREAAIKAERAAREAKNAKAAAKRAAAAEAKRAEQDAEFDRLTEGGMDFEEAWSLAYNVSEEQMQRDNAISQLRLQGFDGAGFDEVTRNAYRQHAYDEWLAAENATNGQMLKPKYRDAGIDTRELWKVNDNTAREWASEDLGRHWDDVGRTTLEGFRAMWLNGTQGFSKGGDFVQ
ncbi:hypothetical protein O4215_20660 [Rhodococcus maanshanensis]|uniref:phage minor capsid protein n=1 Tax=Rhodococcus maanshanensis TaxID=183556 RepID=UPI0022B2E04B|nr:phage minor capsid protein [Rhodococcus maanshanensis]MCZ4557977.1 hypothetical protein [Rhodococcus maanshanensis]